MFSLRTITSTPLPMRAETAVRRPERAHRPDAAPAWRHDQVQWGVVRVPDAFDMDDVALHAGRVQHAFPVGRDWMAACGFRTPLQRAFDGSKRPLLAMPGSRDPACRRCLSRVEATRPTPAVDAPTDRGVQAWLRARLAPEPGPSADPRPLRPAVVIPVDVRPTIHHWPAHDLAQRLHAPAHPRRDAR